MIELIVYQTETAKRPFEVWLNRLRDRIAHVRILRRMRQVQMGNFGDFASVGEGVFELRIHVGAGYRVYYGRSGDKIVILLCGGDKSTQQKDIDKAKEYWTDWQRRSK